MTYWLSILVKINLDQRSAQKNLLNIKDKYPIVLTRARQGMVMVVPEGDPSDAIRLPGYYDTIYDYLVSIGIPHI
jgi:hypothetical protein